jgi:hypothetical protein
LRELFNRFRAYFKIIVVPSNSVPAINQVGALKEVRGIPQRAINLHGVDHWRKINMVNPTDPLALCPSYPQAEIREGFDTRNYREGDPRTLDVILRAHSTFSTQL